MISLKIYQMNCQAKIEYLGTMFLVRQSLMIHHTYDDSSRELSWLVSKSNFTQAFHQTFVKPNFQFINLVKCLFFDTPKQDLSLVVIQRFNRCQNYVRVTQTSPVIKITFSYLELESNTNNFKFKHCNSKVVLSFNSRIESTKTPQINKKQCISIP